MGSILSMLLPALLQQAPSLIGPLIGMIAPSLSPKAPAVAAAVASTTAVGLASGAAPAAAANASNPIMFLQELLTGLGNPVTIDGELGPETVAAMEKALGIAIVPGGITDTVISDVAAKFK
jgi:hypothetical protein